MEFRSEIERLRGLAIVIVVLSHALFMTANTADGLPVLSALRGATWIFVFVAGYLLAHLRGRYTYRAYLDGKLRNVIAPYLVVVSLIVVTGMARVPDAGLAAHYLTGHTAATPLWFVPMIALFYLAFPIYAWLCTRPWLLIGCAVLACAGSVAIGRNGASDLPFHDFAYFQSAYLVGMAWSVKREQIEALVRRYLVLVIFAALIGTAAAVGPFELIRHAQFFSMAPLVALLMIALQDASPLDRIWFWLAPKSFGIFFLHGIVTDRFAAFEGKVSVYVAVALGLAIVAGCGVVVHCAQQVFGKRSRVLVGS